MKTYIVRLWQPTTAEGDVPASDIEFALHGRIEDPLTGRERSFASGRELVAIIGAWMATAEPMTHEARKD